ncbi:MAG: hypothetical protein GVY13_04645 [Alphaproteobacteria bacterium]|jgi:hypothetical protein|nr:hypothetical protein [Alphaproteobacteria bacterium]
MKTAAILVAGLIIGVMVAFWGDLTRSGDRLSGVPFSEISAAADRHCRSDGAFLPEQCRCMVEGVAERLSRAEAREVLLTAAFIAPEPGTSVFPAADSRADPDGEAETVAGSSDDAGGGDFDLAMLWQDCAPLAQPDEAPSAYAPPEGGLRLTLDNGRVYTIDSNDPDLVQYYFRNANWRRQSSQYYRSLVLLGGAEGLSNRIENAEPLERLWPLAVGNRAEYKVITRRYGRFLARRSELAEVLRTETLTAGGDHYETFVVQGRWQVTHWLDSRQQIYDAGDWTAWYCPETGTWLRWEDNLYRQGRTIGSSRMQVVRIAPM